MSKIYITEYKQAKQDGFGKFALLQEPANAHEAVEITDESKTSEKTFDGFVRIHADEDCHIKFAKSVERDCTKMTAGQTEYFGVQNAPISVIAAE